MTDQQNKSADFSLDNLFDNDSPKRFIASKFFDYNNTTPMAASESSKPDTGLSMFSAGKDKSAAIMSYIKTAPSHEQASSKSTISDDGPDQLPTESRPALNFAITSPGNASEESANPIFTSQMKAARVLIDRRKERPQDLQDILKRIMELSDDKSNSERARRIASLSKCLPRLCKTDGIRAIRRDLLGSDALDLANCDTPEEFRHQLAVGITATDSAVWETGSLPNPPLRTLPSDECVSITELRSDTVYGFTSSEIAKDLDTTSLFTEEESYKLQEYQICREVRFPFLTAEWTSFAKGEGRRNAEKRAALVGATNVHALTHFYETAGIRPTVANTAHFSVTCDFEVVAFHVHWQRINADGKLFHEMTTLHKAFLSDEASVTKIVSAVDNVTKMAKEDRLQLIKDALHAAKVTEMEGPKSIDIASVASPTIASPIIAASSVASPTIAFPTIATPGTPIPKMGITDDLQISETIDSYINHEVPHTPVSRFVSRINPAFSASPSVEEIIEPVSSPSLVPTTFEPIQCDTETKIDSSKYSDEHSTLCHVFPHLYQSETESNTADVSLSSSSETALQNQEVTTEEIDTQSDCQGSKVSSQVEITEEKNEASPEIDRSRYEDENANLSHVFPFLHSLEYDTISENSVQSSGTTYHSMESDGSLLLEKSADNIVEATRFDFVTTAHNQTFDFTTNAKPADEPATSTNTATIIATTIPDQDSHITAEIIPADEPSSSEETEGKDDQKIEARSDGASSSQSSHDIVNFRMIDEHADIKNDMSSDLNKQSDSQTFVTLQQLADPLSNRSYKKSKVLNKKKNKKGSNAMKTGKRKN